ncbi:MAG: DNA-directed RNA polymerase subunit omega [candidate division Zixibacteria bacterium]|nr:DNA-directed RNA polymerase subunit omega [candidate division Zixibacteria bacterium]
MSPVDLTDHTLLEEDGELSDQTFAPAPPKVEKPKGPRHHRRLLSLETLRDRAKNQYEAVLIAAARARQLNAKKVAMEERGMEEALELKRLKMTTHALTELMGGKIDVTRPETSA